MCVGRESNLEGLGGKGQERRGLCQESGSRGWGGEVWQIEEGGGRDMVGG